MCILEDLWNGKIRLDEKQKSYEKLEELQYKLFNISEQDAFIVGFRLGARIILDVIGEYKGQFRTADDAE